MKATEWATQSQAKNRENGKGADHYRLQGPATNLVPGLRPMKAAPSPGAASMMPCSPRSSSGGLPCCNGDERGEEMALYAGPLLLLCVGIRRVTPQPRIQTCPRQTMLRS